MGSGERAMVGTEEGWRWVWENEAWRVGVSVDIGCVSTHWEAWVWAGNTIGGGHKMTVVGGLDGHWGGPCHGYDAA